MSENDLAKALREKSTGGSWLKAIAFGMLGMTQSAQDEAAKLGIGKEQTILGADNKPYIVKMAANGTPIEGYNAETGKKLDAKELVTVTSNAAGKATDVSLTPHQAIVNGEVHTISSKRTANGMMYKDDTIPDSKWSYTAPAGLTHVGQQDPLHLKGLTAANSVVTKMEKANLDSMQVSKQPLYTQSQIEQARNSTYQTITGKPYGGGEAAAVPAGATATPPLAPNAPIAPTPNNAMPAGMPAGAPTPNNAMPAGMPAGAPKTPWPPGMQMPAAPAGSIEMLNKLGIPSAGKEAPAGPKSMAQSILDYDMPPPVGPTTPTKIALLNEVQRLASEQGKTWDAGQYKIANKTKQDFTTGKQGQVVTSMNTAVAHLDTLDEAGQALHSGQIPISNKIVKEFATSMGLPQYTNFESIKHVVGSEVAKAVSGSGGSALADRQAIEKEFDSASSPDQLNGVIKKYQELMAAQLISQRQTFTSAGLKGEDFDKKLLPKTVKVINSTQPPTRSKW